MDFEFKEVWEQIVGCTNKLQRSTGSGELLRQRKVLNVREPGGVQKSNRPLRKENNIQRITENKEHKRLRKV